MVPLKPRSRLVALALILGASHASAQTWPMQNGSHDVLHSFQNPFYFSPYFHEGVDLRGWNDDVVAMRGGTVRYVNQGDSGGTLLVEVSTPNGIESDSYLHVRLDPWNVGDTINEGDVVGTVSTVYFGQHNQHHVHVNRFDGYAGGNGYIGGRGNMLHPLAIFPNGPDRDPQAVDAVPHDANEDGEVFTIVKAANDSIEYDFAWRKVDLLLEATDRKSSSLYWNQGLGGVGYWIESFSGGADVRDATTPYRLVRFDDAWRSSVTNCDDFLERALLYDPSLTVAWGPDDTFWSSLATYRLTNTTGTTGSCADLRVSEHWRTDVRTGTFTRPTGSDGLRAREIAEAHFKDGRHVVHALTEDLRGEVDTPFEVVVDNFRPYLRRLVVREGPTGAILHEAEWSYDPVANQLDFHRSQPQPRPGAASRPDFVLELHFSEPVASARIDEIQPALGQLPTLSSSQPAQQRTRWTGTLPRAWLPPGPSTLQLFVAAEDLNGSTLHEFADEASVDCPFNRRADGSVWTDATRDSLHVFELWNH